MRRPHATPLLAVLLLALSAPSGAAEVELEFEWKLRYRPRFSFLPGAVDQWAGARLALDREGSTLALRAPLEHPWVLRWYPGKDELKLGTTVTVAVDETAGHPYAALAPEAARRAAARERAWRDDPFFRDCRERAGETPRLSPTRSTRSGRSGTRRGGSPSGSCRAVRPSTSASACPSPGSPTAGRPRGAARRARAPATGRRSGPTGSRGSTRRSPRLSARWASASRSRRSPPSRRR